MSRPNALARVRQFFEANPDARPTVDEIGSVACIAPKTVQGCLQKLAVEGMVRRHSVYVQRDKARTRRPSTRSTTCGASATPTGPRRGNWPSN